jgi:hypothetical protein
MEKRKLRGVTVGVNRKVSRATETRPHNQPQAAFRKREHCHHVARSPDREIISTDPHTPVHNSKFRGQVLAP